MKSTEYIPCICSNPNCGISFMMKNPFDIQGKNNIVINTRTRCPKCGSEARMADQGTDSSGRHYVNLGSLFGHIRNIKNIDKLRQIKDELLSNKDKFEAEKLVDKLTEIDPEFSKLKGLIKSIKIETAISIITLLITVISLLIDLRESVSSQDQFDELKKIEEKKIEQFDRKLKIDEDQLQLSKDKFEYQKNKDSEENKRKEHENKEKEKRISQLEHKIQEILQDEYKKETQLTENNLVNLQSKKNYLNSLCPCGSGKKAEVCHPFGLIFPIHKY